MSRTPQFPVSSTSANRLRQPPSNIDVNGYYNQNGAAFPSSPTYGTQQRPPSHADSVSSSGSHIRSGPARPARSELRARQLSQSSVQHQADNRDIPGNNASDRNRDRILNTSRSMASGLRNQVQQGNEYRYNQANGRSDGRPDASTSRYPAANRWEDSAERSSRDEEDYAYGGIEVEEPIAEPAPATVNTALVAFQSAGGRRRAMTNGTDELDPYEVERRRERERERERAQRIQARQLQAQRSDRRANGRRARPGDVDAVLDQIQEEWAFVTEPDFNPVSLALSLLDESSYGHDLDSFRRTKRMLEQALRGTVDKHYQLFNAALPHHATLLTSLTKVQSEIADARNKLQETRNALGSKRTDLVQLWSRGQALEEMFRVLDEIERLKNVPDMLESLISEKRLLQASILLVRSLKIISRSDLMEIGALADLRSYLSGQETALREILVEELHSHLYLKVFWCDSRWAPYTPNQQALPSDYETEPTSSTSNPYTPSSRPTKFGRFLNDLALRPINESPLDTNNDSDLSPNRTSMAGAATSGSLNNTFSSNPPPPSSSEQNPEANSFQYMETLVESLAVLGKLGSGLDTVAQRISLEIHSLVDATIDEVSERSEFGKQTSVPSSAPGGSGASGRPTSMYVFSQAEQKAIVSASSLRLTALESPAKAADWELLKDLFWTLYSKLDAVLQGLRVVYEVANRIGSRRDFKDSSGAKAGTLFPLVEIWMPVQSEVRSLLYDYLTDDEHNTTTGRNPIASINEVLRDNRFGRDKAKPVFRLTDTDAKTTSKALKTHENELTRILKVSVPGLVSGLADSAIQTPLFTGGADDRLTLAGANLHRLLIKPDTFHVTVLFQPTIAFSERAASVLPVGMSDATKGSSELLDEFVLKVYLPRLEERVTSLFHNAAGGQDAWSEDPTSRRLSAKPLVKSCTQLMALINSLCTMHETTPFHQESYSRLILDIIIRFYQRCYDRFVELVTLSHSGIDAEAHISVSAKWAQKPEITACLSALYSAPSGDETLEKRLCRQETRVELNFLAEGTISANDLIQSTRSISALGALYQSLAWFIKQLQELKSVINEPVISPTSASVISPDTSAPRDVPAPAKSTKLQLPLTKAMALRYDAILKTYEQLAELILHTIRIDIRCRIIHFLNLAMRQGNYRIETDALEPDPHISDLNADLNACEDNTSMSLEGRDRRFIFSGLGTLMEHLLISNSRHIRFANQLGIKKILRNVLALQQNLKTLSDLPEEAEFARARKYYEMFFLTPTQMLETVRQKSFFTFDEYKSMLNLQCGVDQTLSGPIGADGEYHRSLTELHSLVVDEWDDA